MSGRTVPAAPVVEAPRWRAAFVVVPGTSLVAIAVSVVLDVLSDLLGRDIDRMLGELS
ncbi:hypothetical protein [Actinokineospora spheciospongiae]|uniref:hypothetical protein n=1 Tax=Actinokineospora spheciospongiae TaxID=909613 RepID=UPI000D91FFD5|nr:hypothetical protein [Actinokineospora spheciospongiae]PWW67082.1 hypothetical protein DFQ13_101600 [Actinokineospora spheciospongiae]